MATPSSTSETKTQLQKGTTREEAPLKIESPPPPGGEEIKGSKMKHKKKTQEDERGKKEFRYWDSNPGRPGESRE